MNPKPGKLLQGTVASVGPRGALLHIDVQATNARVYTVAGHVEKVELSWEPVDDPLDAITVRAGAVLYNLTIFILNIRLAYIHLMRCFLGFRDVGQPPLTHQIL